jgi:hypothetical protein
MIKKDEIAYLFLRFTKASATTVITNNTSFERFEVNHHCQGL